MTTTLRRSRARRRRLLARIASVVPVITVLAWDVVHRRTAYPAMWHVDAAALSATWLLSGTLWTCAIVTSARRRGAIRWVARAVIALLGAIVALQAVAYEYFAATIDAQLLQSAWQLEGMATLARPFLWTIAEWLSIGVVVAVAWSLLVGRIARAKRRAARAASLGMIGVLVLSLTLTSYLPHFSTDAAPDVLVLGALGRFSFHHSTRMGTASFTIIPDIDFTRTVPPIEHVQPRGRRNVLFILTESVRASAVCSAYQPDCPHNPFSNAALPDRLALERMRSVDSFTLLSFGVLFTGLALTAPKSDWLTAPLLFDYAHAGGLTTAYWSAQHGGFANSHDWTDHEPIDRLAWASDFDPKADKILGADDADAVDRAIAELPQLHEPFFAVVHFSGTHYPYRVDRDAPFRPLGTTLDRHAPELLRNRYYDAIYRQDKFTASLVKAVRAMPLSARTVIVFTSDHGESFYEHDVVLHGTSLYDTELQVPAWIDAPAGTLSSSEVASLRDERGAPVTHLDLAPTILDLLGLLDVPEWAAFRAHMPGMSLLRSPPRDRRADIATCNDLWACFIPSSGVLIGDKKWVVRPPEPYRCYDTRADPNELYDLGAKACGQ